MSAGIKARLNKDLTVLGVTYEVTGEISADVAPPFNVSIAAAKTGQLTTRTDNDTGTLTMSASHGITTGARLDVYWLDPTTGLQKVRYAMTVGTVATNSVPIDGGAGDVLPANLTNVTAMVPSSESITAVGANVVYLTLKSKQGGVFVYTQSDDTLIYAVVLDGDPESWTWTNLDGSTNPVTGVTMGKIFMSHPKSDQAVTMSGVVGYN